MALGTHSPMFHVVLIAYLCFSAIGDMIKVELITGPDRVVKLV